MTAQKRLSFGIGEKYQAVIEYYYYPRKPAAKNKLIRLLGERYNVPEEKCCRIAPLPSEVLLPEAQGRMHDRALADRIRFAIEQSHVHVLTRELCCVLSPDDSTAAFLRRFSAPPIYSINLLGEVEETLRSKRKGVSKDEVRETFGKKLRIEEERAKQYPTNCCFGVGLEDLIFRLFNAYHSSSTNTVLLDVPNYFDTMNSARENNFTILSVMRFAAHGFDFELEDFVKQLHEKKPGIVVITDPNNPTGKPFREHELRRIIEATPKSTLIFIDRADANISEAISDSEILSAYGNKLILIGRSLSKEYGMYDRRCGYLTGTDARPVAAVRYAVPYLLPFESYDAALMAHDNPGIREVTLSKIKELHAQLAAVKDWFADYGVIIHPSAGCFMVIEFRNKSTSQQVIDRIKQTYDYYDLPKTSTDIENLPENCMRVNSETVFHVLDLIRKLILRDN